MPQMSPSCWLKGIREHRGTRPDPAPFRKDDGLPRGLSAWDCGGGQFCVQIPALLSLLSKLHLTVLRVHVLVY